MNYENIRTRPNQFLSVTCLYVEEFDYLLSSFSSKWQNYYRIHTIKGKNVKRQYLILEEVQKYFQL
jgi:hypothetical protein